MKTRGRKMQIQSDRQRYGVYPCPVRGIFYTEGHNNSNRSKWGGVCAQRGSGRGVVLVMDETEGVTLTTAGSPGASRPPMKTHHYWIMTLLERQRESKLQNRSDFLSIQDVTGGHNCKTNVLVCLNLSLNACERKKKKLWPTYKKILKVSIVCFGVFTTFTINKSYTSYHIKVQFPPRIKQFVSPFNWFYLDLFLDRLWCIYHIFLLKKNE